MPHSITEGIIPHQLDNTFAIENILFEGKTFSLESLYLKPGLLPPPSPRRPVCILNNAKRTRIVYSAKIADDVAKKLN